MNDARKEKEPFSNRVQQIYANFYEQICWFLSNNKISSQDIELFYTDLRNPKIVKFVTEQRKKNSNWYKFYWDWYTKNKNL